MDLVRLGADYPIELIGAVGGDAHADFVLEECARSGVGRPGWAACPRRRGPAQPRGHADREFFIAKAVGWALRTYARQAPDDVRDFVARHPELTPLARREALKHL